ncbi:carbamoyltransferase C-terminal domain-containing protein [uncultured Microscilla sp.]|uniref:carbamoyltransferase C-terminal domain-containing protein n=1 Tax=uncultured Microscilla sp. TaxID=432653 RepID=UPI0026360661|nr:carbamoyltransferase C-terminal domain-containing protein [uncultured Microscilla sp.]
MNPTLAIYGIQDRNNLKYPGYVHDHSLCMMQAGQVVQCLQLERHTRKKHDHQMPHRLETLLNKKLVQLPANCDWVFVNSFVGNSFISKNGKIRFDALPEQQLGVDLRQGYGWLELEKWQGNALNAYSISHELAHVFSCVPFFGNFKNNSLLVSFDGGASLGNFAAFLYQNQQLQVLHCDWELKSITNLFNANGLSFALLGVHPKHHNSLAGKLMGFAAYGRYRADILTWLENHQFFADYWTQQDVFYESAQKHFGWQGKVGDLTDLFLQDIAFAFQYTFQQKLLARLTQLQQQVKADYLYYAGGCALNIPANRQIAQSGLFKQIYIPPCCNDSGLALGGAAFLEWKKGHKISWHSPYLNNVGLPTLQPPDDLHILAARIANALLDGKIIGVCQGVAEIGPRALGNRSILALPNSIDLAKKVSEDCKKREWYRPIAPVMLEKNAQLVTGLTQIPAITQYMLSDFEILPDYHQKLEGVVHVNGTARIQTIFERVQNPLLFEVLHCLDAQGVLGLINTSFNVQGEPMVHTPAQALASGKAMGLDGVVADGALVLFE